MDEVQETIDHKDIIIARSFDDRLIIINIAELRNNHYLDGANIFKILFKINTSNFSDFPFEKDDDNNIVLLSNLGIKAREWYQFISFIKTGFSPKYIRDSKSNHLDSFISEIEELNETCNKLGGIPSFDDFYKNFYKEINDESKFYNPMGPKQDYLGLYYWRIVRAHMFNLNDDNYQGWSATAIEKKNVDYVWIRKKIGSNDNN